MTMRPISEPRLVQSLPTALTLDARVTRLEQELEAQRKSGLSLLVASGDLDKVLSALILATGAAVMGQEAHIFFTFWATAALRRPDATPARKRSILDRLFGWLLPRGTRALALSRMHFGGAGTAMMRVRMKAKGIADCDELFAMARESGVKISVCDATMSLMGMNLDDLVDYPGIQLCGVATFLALAEKSNTTMFI
jgi:peroxiredoxin family protein